MSDIKPGATRVPNAEQQAAIEHEGTPLLVIAGAGTGKTEMLTNRVIRTIERGVPPERIMMLTFTNKAAQNMVQRMQQKLGREVPVVAGTFHGISYRLLNSIGFERGFFRGQRILGEYQVQRIWEKVYQTVFTENERGRIKSLGLGGIPRLKFWMGQTQTGGLTIPELYDPQLFEEAQICQGWRAFKPGCIEKVFELYRQMKFDYRGLDFDDILVLFRNMLREKELRTRVQASFDAFFVDEYQDTSAIQAEILQLLVGDNPNITAVGDPNQSVYAFLSAEVRNILDFPAKFPNTRTIKLSLNYRSTQAVLDFANRVMATNKETIFNPLQSSKPDAGAKPILHKYGSERCEAEGVIRDITALLSQGLPAHHIAVLSRQSFTTFRLEAELTKAGLAYVKYGGLKLTAKRNIRQFLAFLELALDRFNWLAWETILPMIPMIGEELTTRLVGDLSYNTSWDWKNPPPFSLGSGKRWHAFSKAWDQISKLDSLKDSSVESFMRDAFKIFVPLYEDYIANASERELAAMADEDGFDASYMADAGNELASYNLAGKEKRSARPEAADKLKEIEDYIVNLELTRREDLQTFLNQFQLDDTKEVKFDPTGRVIVSTIHSAKGLEWPCVFLLGLEDGTLPPRARDYGKSKDGELQAEYPEIQPCTIKPYLEEERRLFYVACTRAMHTLHLCLSSQRMGQGLKNSPFIREFCAGSSSTELPLNHYVLEKMRTDADHEKYRQRRAARDEDESSESNAIASVTDQACLW